MQAILRQVDECLKSASSNSVQDMQDLRQRIRETCKDPRKARALDRSILFRHQYSAIYLDKDIKRDVLEHIGRTALSPDKLEQSAKVPSPSPTEEPILVGVTSFAAVFKWTYCGENLAMKVFRNSIFHEPLDKASVFLRELFFWKSLSDVDGSRVWRLKGYYMWVDIENEDVHFMLVSPVARHTLKDKVGACTETETSNLIKEVALGLKWLHTLKYELREGSVTKVGTGIAHGDLCTSNVYIDDNGRAWLADLGIAKLTVTSSSTFTIARTSKDSAFKPNLARVGPEVMNGTPRGLETDIFGFGSLVYEMFTGMEPPFGSVEHFTIPPRPDYLGHSFDGLWTLLGACWAKCGQRPSADDVALRISHELDSLPSGWSAEMTKMPTPLDIPLLPLHKR